MNVTELSLPGVKLIEPKIFSDHRGHFLETWNAQRYAEIGIGPFVQDNLSRSVRGTVRGLHLQNDPNAQGKLVHCVAGAVWDVVAEVRKGHPNFGKWLGVELTADNRRQLWVPRGYAHGFAVLSDAADFAYKVDAPYSPKDEVTVRWDDPALKIDWKVDPATVLLAARDAAAPFLA